MREVRKIGIVGIGPRGGYALEKLILELAERNSLVDIHLSLYESTGNFGNGQVYDLNQNSSNWINISERILELGQRKAIEYKNLKIPSFPSYHEWVNKDFNTLSNNTIDSYPPRKVLGEYLSQRFQSLTKPLIQFNIISLHKELVTHVKLLINNKVLITTNSNSHAEYSEVLLTVGHQSTEPSQQISNWNQFADKNEHLKLFKSPYPTYDYLNHENLIDESVIGIRGFGLAMIDVVRAITEKLGQFSTLDHKTKLSTYNFEQKIEIKLVPFSLDGLPPAPKPLNARIDKWFEPTKASIIAFEKHIGNELTQKKAESPQFLIEAFAPIAADIYLKLPNTKNPQNLSKTTIENIIVRWLEDQEFRHSLIISTQQSPEKSMERFITMATGSAAISLDYCIGQVWRHCQPYIYKNLSFNKCSDSVFAKIIQLDESTKRYSYGPPVESIQQLLALAKMGILNLDMVNDPTIRLTKEGWRLEQSGKAITANIMIDSVLDSPKIKSVSSPIVKNMLDDNLIRAVHDDLGVETDEYGFLISNETFKHLPIALLGRLAKGTIIGVDAILECFGSRPIQWAKQASNNHIDWLNKN